MASNGKFHGIPPTETPDAIIAAGMLEHPENALTMQRDPDQVIAEARRAAEALVTLIEKKPNPVRIGGEVYLEYEDWQTLGRFFNVSASVIAGSTKTIEIGEVIGFEASAEALLLLNGNTVRVSAAEAMCLNDEWKWGDKPLFQLRSMAQTRACAKALRNVLAWVVVLAGFRPTPAEEMDGEKSEEIRTPQRRSEQHQAPPADPQPTRREPEPEPDHERDRRRPYRPAPGARYQQRYDYQHRGRDRDRRPAPAPRRQDGRYISDKQLNRLLAIARDARVGRGEVNRIAEFYGFRNLQDITRDYYDDICDRVYKAGE